LQLFQDLFGDRLKGIASRRGLFVQSTLRRGIDAFGQQPLGRIASLARLLQANSRIDAERQRLLLPVEPVSHPPKLTAVWLDQQMKSACIC
jgi:hypothetical protein